MEGVCAVKELKDKRSITVYSIATEKFVKGRGACAALEVIKDQHQHQIHYIEEQRACCSTIMVQDRDAEYMLQTRCFPNNMPKQDASIAPSDKIGKT